MKKAISLILSLVIVLGLSIPAFAAEFRPSVPSKDHPEIIPQLFNGILNALAGAERIFAVIDQEPEVDEGYVTLVNANILPDGTITESFLQTGTWAWKHPHKDGTLTYKKLEGEVQFENVTFGYVPEKTVLHNINLVAKPGQKVALVGSTGSGKTTITNLINRFYDVEDCKIRFDGINIKKIKKDDLRRSLGIVLQDTHLFTGTIAHNIRFGKPEASMQEVEQAAKLANAHDFIMASEEGYDTNIGDRGSKLSGGQRQRISIARAILKNPPILILDEATSALDFDTEQNVMKAIDQIDGLTKIIITHRLSSIKKCDNIIVMQNGNVIETGSPYELMNSNGYFKNAIDI